MGSALTQRREEMRWVMEELYNYPLYFVDSRTIATSVAENTAQQYHIPNLSRDVFLDHWQTRKSIHNQFERLIKLAKEKGYDQVMWTDAERHELIEETGTTNVFAKIGGIIVTPSLSDSILPGITRDSIITYLKSFSLNCFD